MNTYEVKFAREAKPKPSEWVILPAPRGLRLVQIKNREVKK